MGVRFSKSIRIGNLRMKASILNTCFMWKKENHLKFSMNVR